MAPADALTGVRGFCFSALVRVSNAVLGHGESKLAELCECCLSKITLQQSGTIVRLMRRDNIIRLSLFKGFVVEVIKM